MLDLGKEIFNIDLPTGKPAKGSMLISEPFLEDDYFRRSVVCLVDHGRKSMGLVMNRPTGYTLGSLVEGFDDDCEVPIFCGGPLSTDSLFYIHRLGDVISDSLPLSDGLWIGGDFDEVKDYVSSVEVSTEGLIRFFLGYSGWDASQLAAEIDDHVWAVGRPLSPKAMLKGKGDSYWHKYVRSLGPSHRMWLLHPEDLAAN